MIMNTICARITPAPGDFRQVLSIEFRQLAGVTTLDLQWAQKGLKGLVRLASRVAPGITLEARMLTPEGGQEGDKGET